MRTTVAIPDELYHQANGLVGEGSFSRFVREAVQHYVDWLRQQQLTREMEEGYMAEAESFKDLRSRYT